MWVISRKYLQINNNLLSVELAEVDWVWYYKSVMLNSWVAYGVKEFIDHRAAIYTETRATVRVTYVGQGCQIFKEPKGQIG